MERCADIVLPEGKGALYFSQIQGFGGLYELGSRSCLAG